MRALLTLTILSVIIFHADSSIAENEYSKLRETLKREKQPESSFIKEPTGKVDEDRSLSMKDQQKEIDAECKAHRKSAKCLEYRRLARSRWLAEKNACEKNPIGKRCQSFHDYAFKKMIRRQSACRAGLDSRKCAMVRAGAKSSGAIERR
jgi:hypothetical protein